MPWLKQGDAAANHPIVLSALELDDADDRILNELFGFVARCATQSAAYEQDYIVTVGTARHMAGSLTRYNELAAAAKRCGYWTETTITDEDGQERAAWKLVEEEDLFHMILKEERAWTNQRKKDARDPSLTVPVRWRDGDACRRCGKTVSWTDRKSGRAGTYDHIEPGQAAEIGTLIVCCKECNSKRQADPSTDWPLLAAPKEPLYGAETTDFLQKHGIDPKNRNKTPARANGTAAKAAVRAATVEPEATEARPASENMPEKIPAPVDLPDPGRSELSRIKPRRDGTGRVRSGQDGKGSHPDPKPQPTNLRRSRPRRRGK